MPRPPSANVSRLPAIDIGPLREDGARRPSSYYDIPCLPHYIVTCLHVPSLVGRWPLRPVLQHPTHLVLQYPTHLVLQHPTYLVLHRLLRPVLSSSFIRSLLLTNIKNQWLRVINVCKVWRTAVFFLFLCGNVKCICEIMHNMQRKNSHNILTY